MKKYLVAAGLFVAASFSAPAATAEGIAIDEFRFGAAAVNPDFLDRSTPEQDQTLIGAELLFTKADFDYRDAPADDFLHWFLTPRPHVGIGVNLDDNGTDYIYTGLTWNVPVGEVIFLEGSFGIAANNGEKRPTATRGGLGSNVLFRETLGVGANLGEDFTVLLRWEHQSHANLFGDDNQGLSNIGVMFGAKF